MAAAIPVIYTAASILDRWFGKSGKTDAQCRELERQLTEQKTKQKAMEDKLNAELNAHKQQNQQFQDEMKEMKRTHEEDRLAHLAQLDELKLDGLQEQHQQNKAHLRDLQRELDRCLDVWEDGKEELEKLALQAHNEREKIAHFEEERQDPSVKQIVLLGMTGDGKSTFGNRLVGDTSEYGDAGPFVTSSSINSETHVVTKVIHTVNGQKISVVDTPGIADSKGRDREHINNMVGYLRGSGGVNQFMLVKNISNPRLSENHKAMLRNLEHFLGEEFWQFVTIVLTQVEGRNVRFFERNGSELQQEIREQHTAAVRAELSVVGIGFDNYAEVVPSIVNNTVPSQKYMCDYLKSPLEDLEAQVEAKKIEVAAAETDVARAQEQVDHLKQLQQDIQVKIQELNQ